MCSVKIYLTFSDSCSLKYPKKGANGNQFLNQLQCPVLKQNIALLQNTALYSYLVDVMDIQVYSKYIHKKPNERHISTKSNTIFSSFKQNN